MSMRLELNDITESTADNLLTTDSMFGGAVICQQFRNGYRFSVDAVLAAHFHEPAMGETVLDLGAGCGIIGLILMYRWRDRIAHLQALEYQPQLYELARNNFQQNGFEKKCTCIQGDVKAVLNVVKPESFSLVMCNPPYYSPNSGRQSRVDECCVARHQVTAGLDDFTGAAASAVKNGGTVVFIYPAEQFTVLSESLVRMRLEIKQMRCVYSYPDVTGDARLVLVKCIKNGKKGMKILPPLYIYEHKNGNYSSEMQRFYEP